MKIKKYSRWILLLVIFLVSLRAILFTGQLLLANYFLYRNHKAHAVTYIYRIMCAKPILYRSLQNAQKIMVEDFIIKKAIYAKYKDDKNIFDRFQTSPGAKELAVERFKALYPDNFYFHYFYPPFPPQAHWENLDTISLELLADKTLNPLHILLWEKIKPSISPEFTTNLANYCHWQGNKELADFLVKETSPAVSTFSYPGSPAADESFRQLLKTFHGKKKFTSPLAKESLEEYQPGSEDFNRPREFKKKWEFSLLSSNKYPRAASFTMGIDCPGPGQNSCLRLMGFFPGNEDKGKTNARGGAMCKEVLPITKGYYLLSFDYLTDTGKERASFFLCKGLSEVFLPPTKGNWKKVTYFLNNTTGAYPSLKPIFRMWGTGTVLIDNVYMAAIQEPSFNFSRPSLVYITPWK
ncbi:MAG: hypothetical protein MUF15_06270 [Acidobacteria bacterium]|jgi:hypothetical protein|nr:hypothetical protein [Acidobacteriota bacterium]